MERRERALWASSENLLNTDQLIGGSGVEPGFVGTSRVEEGMDLCLASLVFVTPAS